MAGETTEENDESLRDVVLDDIAGAGVAQVLFEGRDEGLQVLLAVDVDDDDGSLSQESVLARF